MRVKCHICDCDFDPTFEEYDPSLTQPPGWAVRKVVDGAVDDICAGCWPKVVDEAFTLVQARA